MKKAFGLQLLALVLLSTSASTAAPSSEVVTVHRSAADLSFQALVPNEGGMLTVVGPAGFVHREVFSGGSDAVFKPSADLADGLYSFELVLSPKLDPSTRRALAAARSRGDESVANRLQKEGRLPTEPLVVSGFFTLSSGAIAAEDQVESGPGRSLSAPEGPAATGGASRSRSPFDIITAADFVIADDLIVQSSACIGLDCVNNEDFGFDTIRLKENNLRIKFEDTSATPGFPTRDWQLTANDSASGGANKFSIEDIDGSRVPFTVLAGAPSNSLFVDGAGRLGLGTATPVLNAHIVTGNTPALRLEQNGSSGFTPQTWDLAGNETSFFLRDATNGSRLPFRVFPNAPSNSLTIAATTGNIGIGTASPTNNLEIVSSGPPSFRLNNTTLAPKWEIRRSNSGLVMDNTTGPNNLLLFDDGRVRMGAGGAGAEMFLLAANGNLTVAGTVTGTAFVPSSDRNLKENLVAVDPDEILDRLIELPISRWNFIHEGTGIQHLGPMAQDFYAAFRLGYDARHIATVDTDGVALAAIQALYRRVREAELQNAALLTRLEALEASASR